jgi:hypothetical protein
MGKLFQETTIKVAGTKNKSSKNQVNESKILRIA